ncbi:TetR/AcrR family transcriptional regulator [Pararhizobium sp. PWRC1-1]|uniref:TetR/AcrR family transcriptional regulator n=1 Tax=Pararhizobium sp. PWRC1-1 TaxID=2804566 RepID=UPI003CF0E7F0
MRYTKEHKSKTRERVLEAAGRQIRQCGVQGIALNGVMAAAGLTHGSFYAHFASKDDFLAEAVEQMFLDSPVSILRGDGKSAESALGEFVDYYLSPEHRDTRVSGCPLPFLAADAPRLNENLRQRLSKGVAGMAALIAGHLSHVSHRGKGSVGEFASSVVSEIVGVIILARVESDGIRSDVLLKSSRDQIRNRLGLSN